MKLKKGSAKIIGLMFQQSFLFDLLKNDEDYIKGDVHQAILNVAYNKWQETNRTEEKWSYADMIEWIQNTYGDVPAFAVLIGKYNQQVGNGGHIQYFDNGYADGEGGFSKQHDESIPLHEELVSLFIKLEITNPEFKIKNADKVLDILKRFQPQLDDERHEEISCEECGGSGYLMEDALSDEEDAEQEEVKCSWCDGGRVEIDNQNYGDVLNTHELDKLDDEYYKVSDKFMESLNTLFKEIYSVDTITCPVSKILEEKE